ncbi:hypothetical protein SAMN04488527_13916 [Aliiroseovarius crassostreae]|uniref:hypothetical protein n=1 Tax=Aliiroseovarius crassostreae TaxID=154981 RepID=UPI0008EE2960|nr:hypothetical protein [Aliiroseovarius crassostreae]SFU92618.1 hypothetical protein SAMN04488527_13916 [Aliiroseovarius crassostreae]
MTQSSTVVVLFDQISAPEFFRRLEWPFLIKAWSKAISWHYLSPQKVELKLAGLDGLDSIVVTRRVRGDKIFIAARNGMGELIQSGVWEYDTDAGLGVCYRRIRKPDLVETLRERLADFCCATFLKKETGND